MTTTMKRNRKALNLNEASLLKESACQDVCLNTSYTSLGYHYIQRMISSMFSVSSIIWHINNVNNPITTPEIM